MSRSKLETLKTIFTSEYWLIAALCGAFFSFFALNRGGVVLFIDAGAVFLLIVEETLWTRFAYLHTAAYGLVILCVGLFMPGGLVRLGPIRRFLVRIGLFNGL